MNYLFAFLIGGVICLIGQVLIDCTNLTPARILTGYVVVGVALGGLGIYDYIVKIGGAGATVPLTGFGYALTLGVKQAVNERGFIGIFTGGLTACSAGIAVALFSALIMSLIFKSKEK